MGNNLRKLPKAVRKAFLKTGPNCALLDAQIRDLSDYFGVFNHVLDEKSVFWFRGHGDLTWRLTPSALRYSTEAKRNKALNLLGSFKRLGEIKLKRPPAPTDDLKWTQLAQHYGLPTRLLDWTQNAAMALYFACLVPNSATQPHGTVIVLNPVDLNKLSDPKRARILDPHQDSDVLKPYLSLTGKTTKRGKPTIAINPVWNSERIMIQNGAFTFHGSREFELTDEQAPSLVHLPILKEHKAGLLHELDRIGVNEMAIFPEPEHLCVHLKRSEDLL